MRFENTGAVAKHIPLATGASRGQEQTANELARCWHLQRLAGAFARYSLALILLGAVPTRAALVLQIGQNFTGSSFGRDSDAMPADANGAVGPNHYVELINGRFSVYDKTSGRRVLTKTDVTFWNNAGITFASNLGVTDPRIVFDTYSQRWFASMIDFVIASQRQRGNRFLLAVSASADPTGTWHGLAFGADPITSYFADFPTLGVDAQGVYLSGDMYRSASASVGPSLVTIPKTSLLADSPSTNGLTSFGILSYSTRGSILQPAMATGSTSSGSIVFGVQDLGYGGTINNTLVASIIDNAATPNGATLGDPAVLDVPPYLLPGNPVQPDGSSNLDDGDNRLSACVRRVGDVVYAVHSVAYIHHVAIRWYAIDAVARTLIQTDYIADSNLDLFYPSIAANEAGTVIIACNGSSASTFVSCYAVLGQKDGGVLRFGKLTLLKSGTASYQSPDRSGNSRWGDYTATTLDPSDPNRFWTIQLYPSSSTVWNTQITELITTPLVLTITTSTTNAILSWPASVSGFQLQHSTDLSSAANWVNIGQQPVVAGNLATVTLPVSSSQGFFRLAQ